jgi:flavin reductase (DIM6/NTAB) family NADH-FMN oxidoreductase RutF
MTGIGLDGGADPMDVRAARRRWSAGVSVVLTRQGDGWRGATVSAFAVVSLEPPMVFISLDRDGQMSELVPAVGLFTVSVLDQSHEFLAERFAGRAPLVDPRLSGVRHEPAPSGLPVLAGALAWFDCQVTEHHVTGDHVAIFGLVGAVSDSEDSDDPLIYYEGRYRALAGT